MVSPADTLHVHGVAAVGKVEATSLARAVGGGTETELAVGACGLRHAFIGILLLVGEVLFDDVVCLHVNLLVGIVLAVMNLLHAAALLNKEGVLVEVLSTVASSLLVEVTNLENVLKTVEGNLDDLVVGADEKIAQRLDTALTNEVANLLGLLQTTRSSVANGPASLLAGLEIAVLQEMDQGRDDISVNDGLDLRRVARSDVGNGPAGLLTNAVLGGAQERQEARQSTTVDDDLSLHIVASDNIANGAQSRSLDRGGSMEQELNESAGDASLDNSLNLFVGTIRKVRNRPASVDKDLIIERVNELRENRQSGRNLNIWLASGDIQQRISLQS